MNLIAGLLQPTRGSITVCGLSPDDLVVIGELWRSSPGTKVTPQLKTIDG